MHPTTRNVVLLGGTPNWVLRGSGVPATLDLDFVNDRAFLNHAHPSLASLLACARASTGYYTRADGTLTSFANNVLRYGTNGLLIEEARTNIILRSQQLDDAAWSTSGSIISADIPVAPDGTTTADKLVEGVGTNSNTGHYVQQTGITIVNATVYAYSIYVKAAERSWIVLRDGDNGVGRYFGIAGAGTVGSALTGAPTTSTIETLANGWYRCTITYTSTGTFSAPIIYLATGDGAADFSGDGASGLYLWGAQLEAGDFATSYIPTTTAAVARAADAVTLGTVGAWFNQTTGAMYSQHILPAISPVNDQYSAAFSAGVATTDVVGLRAANTTATAGLIVASGNVVQSSCDTSSTPTSLTKQAGAWAANDFVDVVGGGTPSTDSSGSIPSGIDRLNIGNHGNTIHLLNGYLRRVAYWNSRLSNAALQALTT